MIFLISTFLFFGAYFLGRALTIIYFYFFSKKKNFNELERNNLFLKFTYPIISMFFIGNFLIFLNFFFNLQDLTDYLFIVLFGLIFINFFSLPTKKFIFKYFLTVLPINFILTISTYGQTVHYDATVYKLQYQAWLKESKIVFGHTNFRDLFGYTGIMEYISSSVWINEDLIIVHLLSVTIFTVFYGFIVSYSLQTKSTFLFFSSLFILFYSFLDNFGVEGGANGFLKFQMTGTYDLIFGILFFFANIIIFQNIIESSYSKVNYFLVSLLLLFSFQVRIFAVASFGLFFFYSYSYLNKTKSDLKSILKINIPLFLVFGIYILRNFIISGCLILPVNLTCINSVYWVSDISSLAERGLEYYVSYPLGSNVFIWASNWFSNPKNNQIFTNFLLSIFIILIFSKLFFEIKKDKSKILFSVVNILFMWFIFFITGPTPRFGMGIFLISIFTISSFINDFKYNFKTNNIKKYILIFSFLVIGATPRLYSYKELIDSNFQTYTITIPKYQFENSQLGWGLFPLIEGDFEKCGAVYNCLPNREIRIPLSYGSYIIFKNS